MMASSKTVHALDPKTELAIGQAPLGKINEELTESSGEEDGSGNKMHAAVKSDFIQKVLSKNTLAQQKLKDERENQSEE